MVRNTLTLVVAALLAAVVGAQGSRTPTAPQRAELFKKNRPVIEALVTQTVKSAAVPNDHVKQAETYSSVLYQFNMEIAAAARSRDTVRVEELSHHLETLLDKGLAPTLIAARTQVANGTGVEEYRKVKGYLVAQVDALLGILADSPTARASLEGAKQRLDEVEAAAK